MAFEQRLGGAEFGEDFVFGHAVAPMRACRDRPRRLASTALRQSAQTGA